MEGQVEDFLKYDELVNDLSVTKRQDGLTEADIELALECMFRLKDIVQLQKSLIIKA